MPYNVCYLNQTSFLENTERPATQSRASRTKEVYNICYMIQKYENASLSYPQWLAAKIIFNGGEVAVQLDSFNEHFGSRVFSHLNFFKQVKVIGETRESSLKLKATLKSVFPDARFPDRLDFKIEDHSVDAVYALAQPHHDGEIRSYLLSEILRMLNSTGKFYLTYIVEDYDVAIHQLYKEFNPSHVLKGDEELHFEELKLYLSGHFSSLKIDDFTSIMQITDADDLIAHILSEDKYTKLKSIIAQTGLSKFRTFLLDKLESEGAITVERHIKLITCFK